MLCVEFTIWAKEGNNLNTIIHNVSLVLALRNSWNDQLIKDSNFVFKIDGIKTAPIKKEAGYYVFTDVEKKEFELQIASRDFIEREISVKLDELQNLDYILELPLIPKYIRETPLNCANFYGKADPESMVAAIRDLPRAQLKFVSAKDNIIKVNNPMKLNIVGATLAVADTSKPRFEVFSVLKKHSFEEYVIDRVLTSGHKENELILKAYLGQANAIGDFNIFVNCQNEGIDFILSMFRNGKLVFNRVKLQKSSQQVVE